MTGPQQAPGRMALRLQNGMSARFRGHKRLPRVAPQVPLIPSGFNVDGGRQDRAEQFSGQFRINNILIQGSGPNLPVQGPYFWHTRDDGDLPPFGPRTAIRVWAGPEIPCPEHYHCLTTYFSPTKYPNPFTSNKFRKSPSGTASSDTAAPPFVDRRCGTVVARPLTTALQKQQWGKHP